MDLKFGGCFKSNKGEVLPIILYRDDTESSYYIIAKSNFEAYKRMTCLSFEYDLVDMTNFEKVVSLVNRNWKAATCRKGDFIDKFSEFDFKKYNAIRVNKESSLGKIVRSKEFKEFYNELKAKIEKVI